MLVQHMAPGGTHNSTAYGIRWDTQQYSTWHQVGPSTVQHMAPSGTHNSTAYGIRWDTQQYITWHKVGHSTVQHMAPGGTQYTVYSIWETVQHVVESGRLRRGFTSRWDLVQHILAGGTLYITWHQVGHSASLASRWEA